jgi:protoporphyrinogen oxidase
LQTEVVGINHQKGRVISVEVRRKGKKQVIKADKFVSSIPLTELVIRIVPVAPESVRKAASSLSYRSEILVALFVKGTKFFPDNWLYVHPPEIPFMRFVETDNFSQLMSPQDKTSFVFEVPCNEGDELWRQPDEKLIEMVTKSFIAEFGMVAQKDILKGVVVRYAKAYPVYELGYQLPLERIKEFVHQFSNLQIIGRYGTFRYNNMDHSVLTGIYAARNILGGNFDIEKINIEQEYLEEKKIGK